MDYGTKLSYTIQDACQPTFGTAEVKKKYKYPWSWILPFLKMYLYALRVPSFITIAQVNMICEAHGGKRRDSLFKKLKIQSGQAYFSFFLYPFFFPLATGMNSLSVFDLQMLFPILYIFFHCLNSVLCTKIYFWWNPIYVFSLFNYYAFSAISKKPLPSSRVWSYIPKFPSKSVTVLAVTVRSLINLGLILELVWCKGPHLFLWTYISSFSLQFVEDCFPCGVSWHPCW